MGFSDSELTIDEGGTQPVDLSILAPTGDNVDPQASLPLTLTLERVDDPQGEYRFTMNEEVDTFSTDHEI